MKFRVQTLLVTGGVIAAGLTIAGCGGGAGAANYATGGSKTTGWNYNDPQYGAFEVREMAEQPTGPGLVFIPGGTFMMGRVAQEIPNKWNNPPRRVNVDSYYIDQTEVRNVDYREYIHWLETIYLSYPEVAREALPDTLVWRKPLGYYEMQIEFYFRLPAYAEYPVVGVSWLKANTYCSWRTDRVNELALVRAGVLEFNVLEQKDADCFTTDAYVLGEYTGKVKQNLKDLTGRSESGRSVKYEDGILLPKYRLPTEAEWEYAAVGPMADPVTGSQPDRGVYPWKGNRLKVIEGDQMGKPLANFQKGRGDIMGVAGNSDNSAPLPTPVDSYWPNDFGLYCMAGNVNEWVLDVYRALSFEDLEDKRPFRGNIYTALVKDENGRAVKDNLGRIKRDTIGVVNRLNYARGDERNYEDGDRNSQIDYATDNSRPLSAIANSDKMYYQGVGPKHTGMSSLVNEHSRVYKGGSFIDRAYYLSPGARRFLDEGLAREDLGFRCAMDRLGSATFRGAATQAKK